MKRTVQLCLALSAVLWVGAAQAADPIKETLSLVPADAMGFIAIPSVAQLDADYQKGIKNLALEEMVQPPMNSLVGMVKTYAPMLGGIDENGPMVIIIMPATNIFELQAKQAVVLSAKDPKAMIDALGGQPGEGDVYTVQFFGQPMQGAIVKNRVVLAQMPEVIKAIKASTASIDSKFSSHEMKSLDELDLIIWLDAQRVVGMVWPMVGPMIEGMMAAQAGQGGFGAKSAEMNKQQLDMFIKGVNTLAIGLKLNEAGLDLRTVLTAKADSELAKRSKVKTTTDPLLRGLPTSPYLLTFGQVLDPSAVQSGVDTIKGLMSAGAESGKVDKEKLAKLEKTLTELLTMITSVRGSIDGLAPGPDGLLGVTFLVETTDSKKWIALSKEAVEIGKQMAAAAMEGQSAADAEEMKVILDAVTYADANEKVGGVEVSHLKVDIDKIAKSQEADEEDIEEAKKILGKEGVLFRVVPVDAKQVVLAFGGGEPRAAQAIEAAKNAAAPLQDEQGIKKVAAHLPKERASVLFVAVDRIIQTVQSAQKVLDEEVLPIQLAPVHAPIGISTTGGEAWSQFDIFIPTELMVAGKTAAMSMMHGDKPAGEKPDTKDENHE